MTDEIIFEPVAHMNMGNYSQKLMKANYKGRKLMRETLTHFQGNQDFQLMHDKPLKCEVMFYFDDCEETFDTLEDCLKSHKE